MAVTWTVTAAYQVTAIFRRVTVGHYYLRLPFGQTAGGLRMAKPDTAQTALLSQWSQCLDEAADQYGRKTAEIFGAVKRGLLKRFLAEAGAIAGAEGRDERLYVCCSRMTDFFRRAVGIYEANKTWLVTGSVREALEFAASAMASLIWLFDEGLDREAPYVYVYVNPILSEKKAVLGTGAAFFAREARLVEDAFRNTGKTPTPMPPGGGDWAIILKDAAEGLRAAYDKALSHTISRLTGFRGQEREQTALCLELLRSELDVLAAIAGTQVPALEEELAGNTATSHEKTIIHGILSVIREAQRYLEGEAAETLNFVRFALAARPNADTVPEYIHTHTEICEDEWLEILRSYLPEAGSSDNSDENTDIYRSGALAGFTRMMESALPLFLARACGKSYLGRPMIQARKLRDEAIRLANGIKEVFAAFAAPSGPECGEPGRPGSDPDTGDLDGARPCGPEDGIIGGILETLAIKSESMNENILAFADEFGGIIARCAPDGTSPHKIADEEIPAMLGGALSAWAEIFPDVPCSDREISKRFNAFIDRCRGAEGFSPHIEGLKRAGERALAHAERSAARFLKDFALHEVSTFEEIINYSVSRLLESEDPAVLAFAGRVTAAADEIYALLERSGIEIIEPRPHDAFNGKEHEVLLAESSPDFARGEIIKRISLGYKKNGAVLLRANVIAAR